MFVVDDEGRQRGSIIRHVDWKCYEMTVTGEAESAQAAIELAELDTPDLLITDIRLMGMSGLELSSRMRAMNANLHIIMVTGYEEFEYAKTALDLGVDAFLVKPVDFNQLHAILANISSSRQLSLKQQEEEQLMKEQLKEQLKELKSIAREKLVNELLQGLIIGADSIKARVQSIDLFTAEIGRRVIIIAIDVKFPPSLMQEDKQTIGELVRKLAQSCFGCLLEELIWTPRGDIALILKDEIETPIRGETEQLLSSLEEELERMEPAKFIAYIGAGPAVECLQQLSESFQFAQRAVNQRLLGGENKLFFWENQKEQILVPEKAVDELIRDFLEVMSSGDSQVSRELLGELMRSIVGDMSIKGAGLRSICLELVNEAIRAAGEIGDVSRQLGPEKELRKRLLDCEQELELLQETIRMLTDCCDFIADRKKSHAQVIVHKAIDYMNMNYKQNLTLRSVAESVFLSPNYLGALLRSELGYSFTDQLMNIRINQAKILLQDPHVKLYEVAENVGYKNIGYFTSLFKRMTGCSPKEYRDFMGVASQD